MPKNDIPPIAASDVAVAFVLLTRLPLPALPDHAFARQARAAWAFPLVGLVVALLAGGLSWAALWLGLPAGVAAGLVLGAQILLTGAMHEDGLADTADGLWGGYTPDRRLEIMKDSAIGTYGVLALILSLGLRWAALTVLLPGGGIVALVAAATLSRAPLAMLMTALPPARGGGLSAGIGAPGWRASLTSLVIGAGLAWLAVGPMALILLALGLGATAALATLARAKIGGQTGDILGATQQVVEMMALLGALVMGT